MGILRRSWLLLILTLSLGVFGDTEFDAIVDFTRSLRDMSEILDAGQDASVDRQKFLLLNGTVTNVSPQGSFYLLSDQVLTGSQDLFQKIRTQETPLARFLWRTISDGSRELLGALAQGERLDSQQTNAVLRELNQMMSRRSIYSLETFQNVLLSEELGKIVALDLKGEELAYLNRLLLEAAFPDDIVPVTVRMEIVSGEWIDFDEDVRSYRGLIDLTGPASFRIFSRRRPADASAFMIPRDTRVLVVVKPVDPITTQLGPRYWLYRGYHIRTIQ